MVKFAEHYAQATLFFDSQTTIEKVLIAAAFRFELSKVGVPSIRERMISSLVTVSPELAAEAAAGLGIEVPDAMPKAIADPESPEVTISPALSLMALPGEHGIRTRQVAILVSDGVHYVSLLCLFRHCKLILALGAGRGLLEMAGIALAIDEDQGILRSENADAAEIASDFIEAIAAHRHTSRDSDPPLI